MSKKRDLSEILALPLKRQKPKPLPPGKYSATVHHNEAGYYVEVVKDGKKWIIPFSLTFPVTLPRKR